LRWLLQKELRDVAGLHRAMDCKLGLCCVERVKRLGESALGAVKVV
jgi:hypothetical protein